MSARSKISIVYIPGLGDRYDPFRRFCLKFWKVWGVDVQLVPMQWYGGASHHSKWEQVEKAVRTAKSQGHKVVVVGESAGGTIAIRAGAELTVDSVVTISGVTSPHTPIGQIIYTKSPSFKEAMQRLPESLAILEEKDQKNLRFVGWLDTVVSPSKNHLPSAKTVHLPTLGHLFTNIFALSLLSGVVVYHIRRVIKRLPNIPAND